MKEICFTIRLDKKDFLKANFNAAFRKTRLILALLAFCYLAGVGVYEYVRNSGLIKFVPAVLFIPLYLVATLIRINLMAGSDRKIFELCEWKFTSDEIRRTGEGFEMVMPIRSLYSVTENAGWFFLWQNSFKGTVLPKKDLSEETIAAIHAVFSKFPGLLK